MTTGCVHRPQHEFRSISTDRYELSVQRSGLVDIRLLAGDPVFENVMPQVWIDGEDTPRPLRLDGEQTGRRPVSDPLGEGQGLVVPGREGQWHIRTYPVQPFLTAQVEFVNAGRSPVHVRAIIPWALQRDRGQMTLGTGSAQSRILAGEDPETGRAAMASGEAASRWFLSVHNPSTRRNLIAGFLTQGRGETHVSAAPGDAQAGLGAFQSATLFDPPVKLEPGESLESEVFYLAVAEDTPFRGLERFANATAVVNRVRPDDTLQPRAWNAWSRDIVESMDASDFAEEAERARRLLRPHGWTHFLVGLGWENAQGDWEADRTRFPGGMDGLAAELREKGFTPALEIAPLIVDAGSDLARAQPGWLLAPNELGAQWLGPNERILDVSLPGAQEHLRQVISRAARNWGFEAIGGAVWLQPIYWAEAFADSSYTRAQLANETALIIREAAGPQTYISAAGFGPAPALHSRGMFLGPTPARQWRADGASGPGAVETLYNAALRYHMSPYLWRPNLGPAYFRGELTLNQSLAWFTAQAMMGGTVALGDRFTELEPEEIAILRRLTPIPELRARPVDLFEADEPRLWTAEASGAAGRQQLAAIFNWGDSPSNFTLYLSQIGLNPNQYYTVYDFWDERYHGTAERMLTVSVPAGSVRLLGFRPHQDRPMFLSVDSHFAQGAKEVSEVQWNAAERRLEGQLQAVEGHEYTLRILVTEGYALREARLDGEVMETSGGGRVAALRFAAPDSGRLRWEFTFE